MTAPTDQFTEYATRTGATAATALREWADATAQFAGNLAGNVAATRPALPDARTAVDGWLDTAFDTAQQVLDAQRSLARSLVAAGGEAVATVTERVGPRS